MAGGRSDRGAAAVEYGLLLAAISVILLVAFALGLVNADSLWHFTTTLDGQGRSGGGYLPPTGPPPSFGSPTLPTAVRLGDPCTQHGAYAFTADRIRVRCRAGGDGVWRWTAA